MSENIKFRTIRHLAYGIYFYGDCLFTTNEEILEHPERAAAFRAATLEGWGYAINHVDEVIEYI